MYVVIILSCYCTTSLTLWTDKLGIRESLKREKRRGMVAIMKLVGGASVASVISDQAPPI